MPTSPEDAMREEFEAFCERWAFTEDTKPIAEFWSVWSIAYRAGQASVGGRE